MTTFFKIYRDLTIFERSLLKILFRPTKNTTFDPSQKSAKNRGRAVLGYIVAVFMQKQVYLKLTQCLMCERILTHCLSDFMTPDLPSVKFGQFWRFYWRFLPIWRILLAVFGGI